MLIFTDPPPFPLKVYGLYTRENVDIYGCPLGMFIDSNLKGGVDSFMEAKWLFLYNLYDKNKYHYVCIDF